MRYVRAPWRTPIDRRTMLRAAGAVSVGGMLAGRGRVSVAQATPDVAVAGADWPLFQGNPARTGVAADPGPVGEPELLWRFESGLSSATASPVIADGLVLFSPGLLGGASLVALDLRTGQDVWSMPLDFQPFGSTPAVADGVTYLAGLQGEVAAVDIATRELRWMTKLNAGITSSPVMAEGVLYIATQDDDLYALDIADGSERWRFSVGEGADYTLGPSPAHANGVVFLGSASSESDEGVFAVDADTGEEIWQMKAGNPGLGTPALSGDTVYVAGEGGDLYAIDLAAGEERWKVTVGRTWSAPAVTPDAVFVQTMDGVLICLDGVSGTERWRVETPASWCSPVVAGENVYIGAEGLWFEQGLYAMDVATGEQRWYMRVASVTAPVAVSGDVLVVADDNGAVCAIVGSDGDAVARGTDGNGAFLTRLVFSTEVDKNNRPLDPAETFPEGTTQLVASFDHVGLKYEAAWEAIWTLDGEALATRSDRWQGSTGRFVEQISANQGALVAGRYGLEVRVDGAPVRRGEVVIG